MTPSDDERDPDRAALLDRVTRLVDFLRSMVLSTQRRILDVDAYPGALWLAELPPTVDLHPDAGPGEVLLSVPPVALQPPPEPPPELAGRLRPDQPGDSAGPPPQLLPLVSADPEAAAEAAELAGLDGLPAGAATDLGRLAGAAADMETAELRSLDGMPDPGGVLGSPAELPADFGPAGETEAELQRHYREWLVRWHDWADTDRELRAHRRWYDALSRAADRLSGQDDEFELVIGAGLLSWATPAGSRIRRHLVTTRAGVAVDPGSGRIEVVLDPVATARFEDRDLLDDQPEFRADRASPVRRRLADEPPGPLSEEYKALFAQWLPLALPDFRPYSHALARPTGTAGPVPELAFAPAVLLRPRTASDIVGFYDEMLRALSLPGATPPLGLAQLVATLDATDRLRWLAASDPGGGPAPGLAVDGLVDDGLGTGNPRVAASIVDDEPLFPLPTNAEQRRVLERLDTDTGVVVQGPPGTGKTHTIANLISALLARGQRVLVTSEKAQALRVLRDEVPAAVQALCVLMTDVRRGGSSQLEQSVAALVDRYSSYDPARQQALVNALAAQREAARARMAEVAEQIRALREAETYPHGEVAPGYRGTLADIAEAVAAGRAACDWLPAPLPPAAAPTPPLSAAELAELRMLLVTGSPARQARSAQALPDPTGLPGPATFAEMVEAEAAAARSAGAAATPLSADLARLGPAALAEAERAAAAAGGALRELGLGLETGSWDAANWRVRAVADHIAHRDRSMWTVLHSVAGQAELAASAVAHIGLHRVELPVDGSSPDQAAALRAAARDLRAHLAADGSLRRAFATPVQRNAKLLLEASRVDGQRPTTVDRVELALAQLDAEVIAGQLAERWAMVGLHVDPRLPLAARVSTLVDAARALALVGRITAARDALDRHLADAGAAARLDSAADLVAVLRAMSAARAGQAAAAATARIDQLAGQLTGPAAGVPASPTAALNLTGPAVAGPAVTAPNLTAANLTSPNLTSPNLTGANLTGPAQPAPGTAAPTATASGLTAPEVAAIAAAVRSRAPADYATALAALATARTEQRQQARADQLWGRLHGAHPGLADLLARTATNEVWEQRAARFAAAWAWAAAYGFLAAADRPGREDELARALDEADDRLRALTAELAAERAWAHNLSRMTAEHSQALLAYRGHMQRLGKGTGRYAPRYRRAARDALASARNAVPAWVMPLRQVLDTIPAAADSFDVVIVDEASQCGLETLFLLWLAPRVIVVGDDKQCAPSKVVFGELQPIFDRRDAYLPDLPRWSREAFTPANNLYGLLEARFPAVIRLREHFRCMPEVIGWSSREFYPAEPLVPLRQFGADRLRPLEVRYVPDAWTEGQDQTLRNPVEAGALVDVLVSCLDDPAYADRTFGVVVLQGGGQVPLIESMLMDRVRPEVRGRRRLRVGMPADFQGDQRDVIFLSMVVAERRRALTDLDTRRRFNVATSRARDQQWLFHSVRVEQLADGDLRRSLLRYLHEPPPPYEFADPGEVDDDRLISPPFESLFEQRVYRRIRGRGYTVNAQFRVDGRRLGLVVTGAQGRLAVECDGRRWHTDPAAQRAELHRDRELRRVGWQIWRIRESAFALDPEAALAPLWQRLARRGIHPQHPPAPAVPAPAAPPAPRTPAAAPAAAPATGPIPAGG